MSTRQSRTGLGLDTEAFAPPSAAARLGQTARPPCPGVTGSGTVRRILLPTSGLGSGRVYLTFDDGPDARWTPRILDILSQANVRATFFIVGRPAREQAPLVRRIAARGHEIGNHSWSHRHPWTMLASVARQEVRDGAAAIANILGQSPRWFRPSHGRLRACMIEEAESGGQILMLRNRSAVDWGSLGAARATPQGWARCRQATSF